MAQRCMTSASGRSPLIPLLLWIPAVIGADQLSKWLITTSFRFHESSVVLPGFFNLTFITNTGGAFGLFAGGNNPNRHLFFVAVALLALVVLVYSYRLFRCRERLYLHAIGLISGGAIGNLIDRLRLGEVIDFLDFYVQTYHWPAFNVADAAISTGVFLFLLGHFIYPDPEDKSPAGN